MSQFPSPRNLAYLMSETPDGNSWRQTIPGFTIGAIRDSAGLTPTGATVPLVEVSSSEVRLKLASGDVRTFYAVLQIPREYDNSRAGAQLMVQMTIYQGTGSATQTIALTAVASGMTGSAKTGYDISTRTTTATASRQTLSWDLSDELSSASVLLKPGDAVTLKFVTNSLTEDVYITQLNAFATMGPNFQYRPARVSTYGTEQSSG